MSNSRNLEQYREYGLPPNLRKDRTFKILTFTSCVAMIMNSDYVSFKEIAQLVRDKNFPQSELQKLRIQSRFLLRKVFAQSWRLEDSLNWGMVAKSRQPLNPPPKLTQPDNGDD